MKKKILSIVLSLVMVICIVPTVFADDVTYTDSQGIMYHLSAGKNFAVVTDGSSTSGNVTIASNVTINGTSYEVREIADNAFYGSSVTSITLPQTLTYIADQAFAFCPGLTSVNFGNSSATLGNKIFNGSINLTSVSNYSNIVKVGYNVFDFTQWYESKKSETTDDAVYFGKVLLTYCGEAFDFVIDDSIVSIAPNAFKGNETLLSIDLANIKSIGMSAFEDCSYLTEAFFGDELEEIGAYAFDGCYDLFIDAVMPATFKKLGAGAFANSGVVMVDLSATTVESIENGTFRNCEYLESVTLSDSTKTIGNYAFERSAFLTDIYANGVITIGYDAFRGCESLSDADAFPNVESIDTGAFDGTAIYENANGGPSEIGKTFYKTEDTKLDFAVSKGIVSISPYAFYNAETAYLLVLPDSLNEIGENAFASLTDGTLLVFSKSSDVYSALEEIEEGTIYIPKGETLENDTADVGYITSIVIDEPPYKTSYNRSDELDPTGIKIRVKTELNSRVKYFNIENIGYTPDYEYDFATSDVVTVNLCGFKSTFKVDLTGTAVKKGDVNGDGNVNSDDIILLRKYIAGLVGADSVKLAAAELNGIDGINSDDLIVLRKVVAGLITIN